MEITRSLKIYSSNDAVSPIPSRLNVPQLQISRAQILGTPRKISLVFLLVGMPNFEGNLQSFR